MDWNLIIYTAIGASLGAVVGRFLSKFVLRTRQGDSENNPSDRKTPKTVLTVVLVILGINAVPAFYKNMTFPRIVPLDTADISAELPVLAIIEKESPEIFSEMIRPLDKGARNNDISQDILNEFRAKYDIAIAEKTQHASAETLKKIEPVSILQHEILKEKAPRICTQITNGIPYPALDSILGTEFSTREQASLVLLFTEPKRSSEFAPDIEKGKEIFGEFVKTFFKDNAISTINPEISDTIENEGEHIKVCDFAIAFSKMKLALSDDNYLNVTEFLNSTK